MKEIKHTGEDRQYEQAGFSPTRAACEPDRPVKRDIEQVTGNRVSSRPGIRFAEDHHVEIVRGRMETDGKPQASGTTQREAPEEPIKRDSYWIKPSFIGLCNKMQQAEKGGRDDGGRPESDSICEGGKRTSSEREFFR